MGFIVALLMAHAVAGAPALCPDPVAPIGAVPVHADFDFKGLSELVTTSYRAAEPRLPQSERRAAAALLTRMENARLAAEAAEGSDNAAALGAQIDEIQADIDGLSKIVTPSTAIGQPRPVAIRIATTPQD